MPADSWQAIKCCIAASAFVDDLVGLIIGPLFVTAEAAFALGMRPEVLREIEARVGPTRQGRAVTPAA